MKASTDYWFTIEPYVHVNIANGHALLYNTLDKETIESDKIPVISLLQELFLDENSGVTLLTEERYRQKDIYYFIGELRKKYMGDIIEVALSNGKPIQVLPYINFYKKYNEKYNFLKIANPLQMLNEIVIHLNSTSDIETTIEYLKIMPENLTYSLEGNLEKIINRYALLSFLDQQSVLKNVLCSYCHFTPLEPEFRNNFAYKISVQFPIDLSQWKRTLQMLQKQTLSFEFIFNIASLDDYQQTEQLLEEYQIEKYQFNPLYNGNNIDFFEENVFLSKEDVLSTFMSMKDFFVKQLINMHDFGKLHIMPNGDVFANMNYPILGNIYTHNIFELIQKEITEGKSWLRIRDQNPCNTCVYQWLCPSPSDYEIAIGRSSLCHVKN